jgi:type IV secretory pathway VirB2 component (pilin)
MIGGIEMKKVLAKIILAFVIFLITMNIQYQSNAYTYSSDSGIYMADLTIDPSQYKPEPQQNTKMNSIVGTILGALQIIGGFAIVLGIAVVGFQILLGSANDKADGKGKAIGFIIGAIMLFSITTIAKLIISAVE